MAVSYDPAKRDRTLAVRGLDFADAECVFAGLTVEFIDDRREYGEQRIVTVGLLDGRMVVLVSTSRGDARHIISMRKANAREQRKYGDRVDRS